MAARSNNQKVKRNAGDLPHNGDAERAVLGSAILAASATLNVISSLNEDDFYEGRHQIIFRAINTLFEQKSAVDILTVSEFLDNIKELENYICHLSLQCLSKRIERKNKIESKKKSLIKSDKRKQCFIY